MVENWYENGKLTPEARRRRRLTTTWSDSKWLYLAIDASSGANSFETEKLRLSAFQNAMFLLNFNLRKASKGRFRIDTLNLSLRRKFNETHCVFALKTLRMRLRRVKMRLRRSFLSKFCENNENKYENGFWGPFSFSFSFSPFSFSEPFSFSDH